MPVSLYSASVPVFVRMLKNLVGLLDKAEAYARDRGFDPTVLVTSRLAPDMFPLSFQIQSATDRAKYFASRVTGRDAPAWPDEEKTLDDLKARLRKAIDYLSTFTESDFLGQDEKVVTLKNRSGETQVSAQDYLLNNAHPNFYFHVTTAYDILRHNGVPVGKRDFVG